MTIDRPTPSAAWMQRLAKALRLPLRPPVAIAAVTAAALTVRLPDLNPPSLWGRRSHLRGDGQERPLEHAHRADSCRARDAPDPASALLGVAGSGVGAADPSVRMRHRGHSGDGGTRAGSDARRLPDRAHRGSDGAQSAPGALHALRTPVHRRLPGDGALSACRGPLAAWERDDRCRKIRARGDLGRPVSATVGDLGLRECSYCRDRRRGRLPAVARRRRDRFPVADSHAVGYPPATARRYLPRGCCCAAGRTG